MMILLAFSFAAGLATILAPCIWPLLPVVLSASSGEGRRRPLGLVLGLMASFLALTLAVSYLEKSIGVDPNVFRSAGAAVIGLMGFSMIFPAIGSRFEIMIGKCLRPFQGQATASGDGFWAGCAGGVSLGFLWAPCAGPILAAIATVAATRAVNFRVVSVAFAYAVGVGTPLFAISLGSSRLFARLRGVGARLGHMQRAFGVVMIAAAWLLYGNYDKNLQLRVLDAFPSYGRMFQGLENDERVRRGLAALRPTDAAPEAPAPGNDAALKDLGPAPEFPGISRWLNSPPLMMRQLRGKVVLVDFWTYSCINCLRTLPYLKRWQQAYGPSGLVVIGIHSPEFAFEKKTSNVSDALRQFGISYPVGQDNELATWNAYHNLYWPAEYLVDASGRIRVEHFGEGRYDEMDAAIRALLAEAGRTASAAAALPPETGDEEAITPETYLGRERMERFASAPPKAGTHRFVLPGRIAQDHFAYEGTWDIADESAAARRGSSLELRFRADQVYLVIGPRNAGQGVEVHLDGRRIGPDRSGADVRDGRVRLDGHRLYHLVDLHGKPGSHLLRLKFDPGVAVYAFTFG